MEIGYVQRVTWIDAMRGVCMFMVILYHSGAPVEYDKFLIPFILSGFSSYPAICFTRRVAGGIGSTNLSG